MVKPTQSSTTTKPSSVIFGVIVLFFVAVLVGVSLLIRAEASRQRAPEVAAITKADRGVGAGVGADSTVTPSPTGSMLNLPLLAKASVATATPTTQPDTATPTTLPTISVTPSTPVPTATLPPGAVAIVTLGDSLTEGDQDTVFNEQGQVLGYPGRLLPQVQALTSRGGSVLSNLGKSGWDSNALVSMGGPDGNGNTLTAQLPRAVEYLQVQMASGKAGIACVLIGSNDLWYLYNEGYETNAEQESENLTNYSNNIEAILSQLRATGATVLIGMVDDQSLRPVAADPARRLAVFPNVSADEVVMMSAQAQRYNEVVRAKAAQHGAIVVDFYHTTIFTDPATIGEDGNHPNSAGYDAMAAMWMGVMREALGE